MDICNVSTIDPLNNRSWDEFVYSHPFGWLYHTSAWAEILEKSFKHIRPQYLALIDQQTDEIKAALPLCHVKSWIIGNRLVSLPYATICDPLITTREEFEKLFQSAKEFQERSKSNYIEIRALKSIKLLDDCNLPFQSKFINHYLLLNQEPEGLLKRVKRTHRQNIRRAEKANIEIYEATREKDLKEFYELYLKTRRRLSLPPQPYRFIKMLWKGLYHQGYLTLLMGRYQANNIGGIVLFKFKDRASAEYLVSDGNYFQLRPGYFLMWSAIMEAKKEGFKVFDFGRTSIWNTNLLRFKRGWGTTEANLSHSFYPNEYSNSVVDGEGLKWRFITSLCKTLPNPAFRAFGYLCHRHHG